MRSGDGHVSADPVTYEAGSIIDVYVRVTDYHWKYRGFLMNAVNDLNETVGEWTYPELEDANFWSPPNCAQSALHTSANLKPFRSLLRFKTPPPGTGRLTFRALVKKGPANDGEFFYPNGARGALVLEEVAQIGGQLPWAPTWHIGKGGQSCSQVCGSVGKDCDSATMKTEAKNLIANVGNKHSGALPVLQVRSTCARTARSPATPPPRHSAPRTRADGGGSP